MPLYAVSFRRSAEKELQRLDDAVQTRVLDGMQITSATIQILIWIAVFAFSPMRMAIADDAVAFDSTTGMFGAYWSSTNKAGTDFKDTPDAKVAALLNAQKRGCQNPCIVWTSGLTGYFAVAVGRDHKHLNCAAVGFGSTDEEAATRAIHTLATAGAMEHAAILCTYFSYGTR